MGRHGVLRGKYIGAIKSCRPDGYPAPSTSLVDSLLVPLPILFLALLPRAAGPVRLFRGHRSNPCFHKAGARPIGMVSALSSGAGTEPSWRHLLATYFLRHGPCPRPLSPCPSVPPVLFSGTMIWFQGSIGPSPQQPKCSELYRRSSPHLSRAITCRVAAS